MSRVPGPENTLAIEPMRLLGVHGVFWESVAACLSPVPRGKIRSGCCVMGREHGVMTRVLDLGVDVVSQSDSRQVLLQRSSCTVCVCDVFVSSNVFKKIKNRTRGGFLFASGVVVGE